MRKLALCLVLVTTACGTGGTYFGHQPGEPMGVTIMDAATTNYSTSPQIMRSGTPEHPTPIFNAWLEPGKTFSHTFASSGTFEFFSGFQPSMHGRVTVR
jgi:hypothetical protein